jgi:hypothetical protein
MWIFQLLGVLLIIVVLGGAGAFVQKHFNWPWK